MEAIKVRPARTGDIKAISDLCGPLIQSRVLLGKERVELYESVQEFFVAENPAGKVIACGALHVMWEDLGEVRTVAVDKAHQGTGVGKAIVENLFGASQDVGFEKNILPHIRS